MKRLSVEIENELYSEFVEVRKKQNIKISDKIRKMMLREICNFELNEKEFIRLNRELKKIENKIENLK